MTYSKPKTFFKKSNESFFSISRGIGGQFRITQRFALSNLYETSCCRCKQTISPAEQWYFVCQFKAFVDMQYFLKQLCCLSLIKLHIVQGVNNVQKCLITAFSSLTTKLGRCHPNVCTAETGSQLLTVTSYLGLGLGLFPLYKHCMHHCNNVSRVKCSARF
jgi:hypothetical protein